MDRTNGGAPVDLEKGGLRGHSKELHFPLPKHVPSLQWRNMTFSVSKREILHDCSGVIHPGEFTAILGPSGSGKTTLMNILSGRQNLTARGLHFQGSMSLDNHAQSPEEFRRRIAYVMQDDALVSTCTPREILQFSATLKLKKSKQEIDALVDDMIEYLRLGACQNTMVGSQLKRGVSGGERKRTSVGVELITQPSMIFLDEPLTGLDSYGAVQTSRILKGLAQRGVTVMMTVHQPSSEVFELFDNVLVLNEGEIAYHGPRTTLVDYFEKNAGLSCPPHHNVADFVLYALQTETSEVIHRLVAAYRKDLEDTPLSADKENDGSKLCEKTVPYRAGFYKQLLMLGKREFRSVARDPAVILIRYVIVLFTGLLLACVFRSAGGQGSEIFWLTHRQMFQPYFAAIVMMCLMQLFGPAQTSIIRYPEQRTVFLREYAANMYSVFPYVISKTIVELPLALFECFIHVIVSYWIINLQGNFIFWLLLVWLINLVSSSLAQLLGATCSTITRAMQMMPLLFVPQIVFSGLLTSLENIPVWLRWGQYLSYLKYGVNLGFFIEFGFDMPTLARVNNIYANLVGLDVGILLAMLIIFRTLAVVVLQRKARFVN